MARLRPSDVAFILPWVACSVARGQVGLPAEWKMRIGTAALAAIAWASNAMAGGLAEEKQFPFTPETFGAAFDQQAASDGTDEIVQCVEVHRVSDCRFRMTAFKRAAPAEAGSAIAQSGEEMPDEAFEFLRYDDWKIGGIDFYGSGSTPARRAHYVGQFKTLLRVLNPVVGKGELEQIVDDLGLRSAPNTGAKKMRVDRPFVSMTCSQGGAGASSITCRIAPAAK